MRSSIERTRGASLESWFAVVTKPRSEAIAEQHLVRQGYECLFPRVHRVLRSAAGMAALGFCFRGNIEQHYSQKCDRILFADAVFENTRKVDAR